MTMNFTVALKADFSQEQDADNLIQSWDVDTDMLNMPSRVDIEDVNISGTVVISGRISLDGVEVSAEDLEDFDAQDAFESEGIDGDFSDAEFEVTDSPTGFEEVESAVGDRDTAITVYAALSRAGYEVR